MNPKKINDWIIVDNKEGWQYSRAFNKLPMINYDVMPSNDETMKTVGLKTMEGFLGSNIKETDVDFRIKRKLTQEEIRREVIALQDMGHKRLALEAGEHPSLNPIEYILESIQTIYSIKHKNGAIRRVNVNIAATTVENYRRLKEAGIGTYILFQETYHKDNYEALHPTCLLYTSPSPRDTR